MILVFRKFAFKELIGPRLAVVREIEQMYEIRLLLLNGLPTEVDDVFQS